MRGPNPLENVKQHVKDTKARKQEARFFVMLRQLDTDDEHGRHVLLVECTRSGASGRRRSRWKKQGYEKHKPKNSKKLKLAPGQEFYIQLTVKVIFRRHVYSRIGVIKPVPLKFHKTHGA